MNESPKIVEEKNRIGDWEIDTIIGKQQKQAVISIVERFSKKTILKKVSTKSANVIALRLIIIACCRMQEGCSLKGCRVTTETFIHHGRVSQK